MGRPPLGLNGRLRTIARARGASRIFAPSASIARLPCSTDRSSPSTVTVTAPTTTTSGRLVADLTGLKPSIMASLSVCGGPVGTNTYLVVRTRWIGWFVGGRWHVSVALTPQMWSSFSFDVAHRGGAHVVLVQGARSTSAMLTRK